MSWLFGSLPGGSTAAEPALDARGKARKLAELLLQRYQTFQTAAADFEVKEAEADILQSFQTFCSASLDNNKKPIPAPAADNNNLTKVIIDGKEVATNDGKAVAITIGKDEKKNEFEVGANVEVHLTDTNTVVAGVVISVNRSPDGSRVESYQLLLAQDKLLDGPFAPENVRALSKNAKTELVEDGELRASRIRYLIAQSQLDQLKPVVKHLICYAWQVATTNTEVFWREKHDPTAHQRTDPLAIKGKKDEDESDCDCAERDQYSPLLSLWKIAELNRGDNEMAVMLTPISQPSNQKPLTAFFQPECLDFMPFLGVPRFSQTIKTPAHDDAFLTRACIQILAHCWNSSIIQTQ